MAKLHELLAVAASLNGQAEKLRTDLMNVTFEKKLGHFRRVLVTTTQTEAGTEPKTVETSTIQTSAIQELDFVNKIMLKAINTGFAIDVANTQAKADIIAEDGTVLAKDVPATSLMQLGHQIKAIVDLIHSIPTLDPAKGFELDANEKKGVYKARPVERKHGTKEQIPLILYPHTDKHPAQVQLVTKDVTTSTSVEQEWSSLISTYTKAELLENAENLQRAVAQARARANTIDIDPKANKIGEGLLAYIFGPLAT